MARDFPSRSLDKFILRLPNGMRDAIAAAAKANNRSMNAEIVVRLQNSFGLTNQSTTSRNRPPAAVEDEERLPTGMLTIQELARQYAEEFSKNLDKALETKGKRGRIK